MALLDDLQDQVKLIFRERWTERNGIVAPEPKDIRLGNDAIYLKDATVLYADLDGSTNLVDSKSWAFAAEIYKTYLHCATKVIKDEGGYITSYDGDRVMGVFLGNLPSTTAARCALKISYCVSHIINPSIKAQYSSANFEVRHVIGIDHSEIRAARTGVRGDNDIVWVGRAPNYAAKLTSMSSITPIWITNTVYGRLTDDSKFGGAPRRHMWTQDVWPQMNNMTVYKSNWWWRP